MKILHAVLILLLFAAVESLRFLSKSRNTFYASKVLQVTLSFKDASRSAPHAARRRTALWHASGGTGDEPYLQHICPSCSYVYDESKGFKKRHPPGKMSLTIIADYYERRADIDLFGALSGAHYQRHRRNS